MLGTIEQHKISDKIFHKHGGPFGCPDNFGFRALIASEIEKIVVENHNEKNDNNRLSENYDALREFRKYILSLDGYGFRGDFFKIQSHKEGFISMEVEELLVAFSHSNRNNWESDREYYFALFKVIEDKLEENGVNLGFDNLFEFGV